MYHINTIGEKFVFDAFQPAAKNHRFEAAAKSIGQ
jgi:hypothetical protein